MGDHSRRPSELKIQVEERLAASGPKFAHRSRDLVDREPQKSAAIHRQSFAVIGTISEELVWGMQFGRQVGEDKPIDVFVEEQSAEVHPRWRHFMYYPCGPSYMR